MTRFTRSLTVLCLSLTLLGVLAAPTLAAPGGNSANAKACQKGGWASLARTNYAGTAFVSEEECVSFTAQGGTIVPYGGPDLTLNAAAGTVSGTGFSLNSQLHYFLQSLQPGVRIHVQGCGGGEYCPLPITDAGGAFMEYPLPISLCGDPRYTTVTIKVVDALGVTYEETFALSC